MPLDCRVVGARTAWGSLFLAWTAVCHGCNGATADASGTPFDTLFIGVASPTWDRDRPDGDPINSYFGGVEIAVAHLNGRRGSAAPVFAIGMPAPSGPGEGGSEPSVQMATAFRERPAVIGVVGHPWSSQTIEAAPIYGDVEGDERRALVAVTPTATNPTVTSASRWVFRVCPTDHDAARALALYAVDAAAIRRVAIMYRNDLFGRGFRRVFRDAFEAVGGKIVEEDPYVPNKTPLAPYLVRMSRRDVDGLVLAGISEALDVLSILDDLQWDIPVLGSDDLGSFTRDPATRLVAANVRYVAFYLAERSTTPENRRFRHDYQARFGILPDHVAALSYDAAMLIGSAALEVGPDRHRIRDWIAERGRSEPAFAGATGPIRFNHDGDVVNKPVLIAEVGR